MQKKYLTLLFVTALSLAFITFGCDSQGPAEKAGEKVDKTVEATKDTAEKTAEKIDEATKPKN